MKYIEYFREAAKRTKPFLYTPEYIYLVLAIFFGCIFATIVPPFYNADESNHILRAYQISTGNLFSDPTDRGVGGAVPLSFVQTIDKAEIGRLFQHEKKRSVTLGEAQFLGIKLNRDKNVIVPFPNTSIYSPVVYLPYLPFIEFLKLFNTPPIIMLYVCRLVGLLAASLLFFAAIRTIPFGKWALVAIGLIPMTVSSFASVSADGMTIGLCTLLVAYIVKLAYQKQSLNRQQMITLGLLLTAVALAKTTYILFGALALLIPLLNTKTRDKRGLLAIAGVTTLAVLAGVLWQFLTSYVKNIHSDPSVNPAAQLHGIISHPIAYLYGPFKNTLLSNEHNGMVESTYGFFASLTTPLPYGYVLLSSFVVLFSILAMSSREASAKFKVPPAVVRLLAGLVIIGTTGLMSIALYMYWTPVDARVIAGLQGRYFIPLLALGILLFHTRKVIVEERFRNNLVLGISCGVLIVSLVVCMSKFYVTPIKPPATVMLTQENINEISFNTHQM